MQINQQISNQKIIPFIKQQALDTKTVLMLFVEIAIIIIYLLCVILVWARRAKKLLACHNRKYYVVIFFYVISKLVLCTIIVIQIIIGISTSWVDLAPLTIEILIKTAISLADLSIVLLFLVSLEAYYRLYLSALKDSLSKKQAKILSLGLKSVQILTGMLLLVPLLFYCLDLLDYHVVNAVSLGLNSLVLVLFLATFFYLNFKMTGVLLEGNINNAIKRIYKVQLILLVSRLFMLAFQVLIGIYIDTSFQDFIEKQSNYVEYQVILGCLFVGSVIYILLTEGLPVMYSFRSSVVEALSLVPATPQFHKESIFTGVGSQFQKSLLEQNEQQNRMALKKFIKVQNLTGNSNQSIWSLKKGQFQGQNYIIRISKYQLSSYILEDIDNQLSTWSQINNKNMSKISYFMQGEIIHLVQKFYPLNLDQKIQNIQGQRQILKIALQLAEAIMNIHQNQVVHGCLSPHHIFFQGNSIIINGFGLHSMRKYLSLITGYTNKNVYTATEHLRDRNVVVWKPKKKADIYSFGIILYELITKNKQYRLLSLEDIKTKFAQQNFRPKLPEYIKFQLKNLIRKCWNDSVDKRPEIQQIIEQLRQLIF